MVTFPRERRKKKEERRKKKEEERRADGLKILAQRLP